MKWRINLFSTICVVSLLIMSFAFSLNPTFNETSNKHDNNTPEIPDILPDFPIDDPFNLTNDYQLIWEPNSVQGSTHAVAASPNKNLIAIAGGYLSDMEVHIYRWNNDSKDYIHAWDSGDGVFQGDVMDVEFADTDMNGFLEIIAVSTDGKIYVFEQQYPEDADDAYNPIKNMFDLVWDSSEILSHQIWALEVADLNHDGITEIIVGCWDNKVHVFEWVSASGYPYCSEHRMEFEHMWDSGDTIKKRVNTIAVGDTDNDFRMEIAAGSHDCKVHLFESKPCQRHNYTKIWDSGDRMMKPVNSIVMGNDLDDDSEGEIVASSYGHGVFAFHYNDGTEDFDVIKIMRQPESWEYGVVETTGVYTGYELDPFVDQKTYGWQMQGIQEPEDGIPYPWSIYELGGESALGGPIDGVETLFNATQDYSSFERWGHYGDGPGEFYNPTDVAFDAEFNVYVLDTSNNRVQKFNQDGTFILEWGSEGDEEGQFDTPAGLDIGPDGFVFVSDTNNHRIQKFHQNGTFLESWGEEGTQVGEFSYPAGIAVNESGVLYVCDFGNNRIQTFNCTTSVFIDRWGSPGDDIGEFNSPTYVAIDSLGDVFIADYLNNRIQKFSSEGDFKLAWGVYGESETPFDRPNGVAVDSMDNVYVTEYQGNRILKFTNDAELIAIVAEGGLVPGTVWNPRGLRVAPNDAIFCADQTNNRIQIFAVDYHSLDGLFGEPGTGEGRFDGPFEVAFDSNGNMFVSETMNDRIQKFAPNGTFLTSWQIPGDPIEEIGTPLGLAVDSEDYVYVVNEDREGINKFDNDGNLQLMWGGHGVNNDHLFFSPKDVAYGPDGYLYITDWGNHYVKVFATNGTYIDKIGGEDLGPNFLFPYGLSFGPDGSLYVADTLDYQIEKINVTSKSSIDVWNIDEMPYMVGTRSDGCVYVSASTLNRIHLYTDYGKYLGCLEGRIGNPLTSCVLKTPRGITQGNDGLVYICDGTKDIIFALQHNYTNDLKAEVIVDFGEWEELVGTSNYLFDLYVLMPTDVPDWNNIEISISPDYENYATISSMDMWIEEEFYIPEFGDFTNLLTMNVDPVLEENGWESYRYVKIGVKGNKTFRIDSLTGLVAKPIDTALVLSLGDIDLQHGPDYEDGFREVLIGTVDGAMMAYNAEGGKVWESLADQPQFYLESSIRDIVQLDNRGIMPTWHFDERIERALTFSGFDFQRFESYDLGDMDNDGDRDLVVTILTDGGTLLQYLENTGSDAEPVFEYVADYFPDRCTGSLDSEYVGMHGAVAVGDINADNDLDFVLTWSGDVAKGITYYIQDDVEHWQAYLLVQLNSWVEDQMFMPEPTLFDINGDNYDDLFLASENITFFANDYDVVSGYNWIRKDFYVQGINDAMQDGDVMCKAALSDFDYDGDFDITISHSTENYTDDGPVPSASRLTYFENTGSIAYPTWTKQRSIYEPDFRGTPLATDRGYCAPTFYDMNNDDILDLIVMQDDRINCYHGILSHDSYIVARYPLIHLVEIDKRTESYGYEAYDSWDNHEIVGNWTRSVEIGDTDQDGKPEAIVGTFDNNVYTFEQVANNTYRRAWRSNDIYQLFGSTTVQWPAYADAQDIAIGDQDQDGKMEIIIAAAERIFVFENIRNDYYELVWQSGAIVTENVLGYKKDITQYTRPPLTEITAITVDHDLDNDNASEIIGGIDSWFFVFECTGDNNYSLIWKKPRLPYTGYVTQLYDIVTGDTDQDGFREVIVVGADEKFNEYGDVILAYSWFEVYENYENVTYSTRNNMFQQSFDSSATWALPGGAYSVALGDHNYNGVPEIFIGNTFWIYIFESNADNSYLLLNPLDMDQLLDQPAWSLALGNTDGDSYQEIIAGVGNQIMVFEQDWTTEIPNHNYTIVWNSSELAERITDIAIGDTNRNNNTEILVSAMRGNVYCFEWLSNVTAASPAELAQVQSNCLSLNNGIQQSSDLGVICITFLKGGRR